MANNVCISEGALNHYFDKEVRPRLYFHPYRRNLITGVPMTP